MRPEPLSPEQLRLLEQVAVGPSRNPLAMRGGTGPEVSGWYGTAASLQRRGLVSISWTAGGRLVAITALGRRALAEGKWTP